MNNYMSNFYKDLSDKIIVENKIYPHSIINNFLPKELINELERDFKIPIESRGDLYGEKQFQKNKFYFDNLELMPLSIQKLIKNLYSKEFLFILEKKFNLNNLLPDFSLSGGGMHESYKGGFLKVHSDFILQKKRGLKRRLNLIIYLNKDWKEDWAGALEFWDPEMKKKFKEVQPLINNAVIFETTAISNHGFPKPLMCPENISRKSIALYYYTDYKEDLEFEKNIHNLYTTWKLRPRWPQLNQIQKNMNITFLKKVINKIFYKW